jgi:hypothetical protein
VLVVSEGPHAHCLEYRRFGKVSDSRCPGILTGNPVLWALGLSGVCLLGVFYVPAFDSQRGAACKADFMKQEAIAAEPYLMRE